jgi:hypothetical protein
MSVASFLVGAMAGGYAVSELGLKLDQMAASLDAKRYSSSITGGVQARYFNKEVSVDGMGPLAGKAWGLMLYLCERNGQAYFSEAAQGEHPRFTQFRQAWNGAVWQLREAIVGLVSPEDKKG